MGLFDKLFGTRSQRELKKIQPTVDKILALEEPYKALSEEQLRGKTAEFKQRLALSCAAHRRHRASSGPDCGDEDR